MKYLIILLLISCTSHKYHLTPDGKQRLAVTCENALKCHERARDVCGGNYKIVDKKKLPIRNWRTRGQLQFMVKCDAVKIAEEKPKKKKEEKKSSTNWFKPFEYLGEIIGALLIFI